VMVCLQRQLVVAAAAVAARKQPTCMTVCRILLGRLDQECREKLQVHRHTDT
jgi:hypothetical protein